MLTKVRHKDNLDGLSGGSTRIKPWVARCTFCGIALSIASRGSPLTMLAGSLAILLIAQSAGFDVLRTLDGPDLLRDGIDAQVINLPTGLNADAFAEQVVQAEYLKTWDGSPAAENKRPEPLAYKAITEGSGRSVVVYYSRVANGPKVVCRLRTKGATGLSAARYRALRWCAGQVGVELPSSPTPPVGKAQ